MRVLAIPKPAGVPSAMNVHAWIMLVALSWLWGGSFFLAAVAVVEVPPISVVFARLGLSSLLLALVVCATGQHFPGRLRLWRDLAVMGAFNSAVPFALIFWSQTHIASGLASILVTTTPLFTVLLAHVLTVDERLTPGRLLGALLGLAGAAVMIGVDALQGLGADVTAQLAVLAAASSYAASGIYGRRLRALPPLVAAAGQTACGALLLLPAVLLVDRPWSMAAPSLHSWAAIVALATLCTALAYVLYFRILATAGATNASLVTFLVPVTAIALGTAILGEPLEARHLAGIAAIALGLAAIDGRPARSIARVLRR